MSEVEKCPVCNGNGLVPNGFYLLVSGDWASASTEPETCRSCQGKGYVIINSTQSYTISYINNDVDIGEIAHELSNLERCTGRIN